MTARALRPLLASVAEAAVGASPMAIAAALVEVTAGVGGWQPPADLRVAGVTPARPLLDVAVPSGLAGPGLLGVLYEAALAPDARTAGAHYTPADLAARLVGVVAGPDVELTPAPRAWDPACGGGVFLLALADALLARGLAADEIVGSLLWGTDIDPGAVAVAEASLCWWAHRHGGTASPGPHLAVADSLLERVPARPRSAGARLAALGPLPVAEAAGFDLVVGNPPFQGQLAGSSVRSAELTAALRERWGAAVVRPYTDTSALFLVAAARALAPGGRLAMILPTSVLAARDAAPARAAAAEVAPLIGLWVAAEPVFGAAVQVCAAVLERPRRPGRQGSTDGSADPSAEPLDGADGGVRTASTAGSADPSSEPLDGGDGGVRTATPPEVRRWKGRSLDPLPAAAAGSITRSAHTGAPGTGEGGTAWAALALAALGVPDPPVRFAGRLGSISTGRAGFRDEYYGLVGHVVDAPEGTDHGDLPVGLAALVTSGLVDPGRSAWGERPASFARTSYQRPVVDLASLADAGNRAHTWVTSMLVPKVVVATQTRVGEAAVDASGRWVASTPTIAVVAPPDRLWEVAAVVCSPVGTIAALAATAGSARAGDAIRHTVTSVAALPLPVDVDAWAAGADALRVGDRPAFLAAMAVAYSVPPGPAEQLAHWWLGRAPAPPPP